MKFFLSSVLRSAFRILAATAASLLLLIGLAAAAIRQPTFGGGAPSSVDGPRADPGRLRRHVDFLTSAVSPRDSDHPENLNRAAAYVRDQLSRTGAGVENQVFEVRGRSYRNVIASFGPESGVRSWSWARTTTPSGISGPIRERTTTPAAPPAFSSWPASSTAGPFASG